MNVMLLEDDAIISMDIRTTIDAAEGFKCYPAFSAKEAFKTSHKTRIDIAICDINLQNNGNGIEVAKFMKALHNCEILFLTSCSDEETLQEASSVDFSGYLLKPFKEDTLLIQLRLLANKVQHHVSKEVINDEYYYDYANQLLYFEEEPLILTPKEHRLFLLLLNAKARMIPYQCIDDVIWQDTPVTDSTRRQLFHRLRTKTPGLMYETIAFGGYILHR